MPNQISTDKLDINAEFGNTVVNMDYKQMHACGWKMNDFIEIAGLGWYGFTGDIITAMKEYEIFPRTFRIYGRFYVRRDVIFGIVQRFLENTMVLYRTTIEAEQHRIAAEQDLKDHPPVPLTLDEAASSNVDQIITKKQQEQQAEQVETANVCN